MLEEKAAAATVVSVPGINVSRAFLRRLSAEDALLKTQSF